MVGLPSWQITRFTYISMSCKRGVDKFVRSLQTWHFSDYHLTILNATSKLPYVHSVVYLHLQPCDVFSAHLRYIRVSRMGYGDWLAVYSIIIIVNSCCDDIQTDGHYWNYQGGMYVLKKGYLRIRSYTSICLGVVPYVCCNWLKWLQPCKPRTQKTHVCCDWFRNKRLLLCLKRMSPQALGKCEWNTTKGKFGVKPLYLHRSPVEVQKRDSKRQLLYWLISTLFQLLRLPF